MRSCLKNLNCLGLLVQSISTRKQLHYHKNIIFRKKDLELYERGHLILTIIINRNIEPHLRNQDHLWKEWSLPISSIRITDERTGQTAISRTTLAWILFEKASKFMHGLNWKGTKLSHPHDIFKEASIFLIEEHK